MWQQRRISLNKRVKPFGGQFRTPFYLSLKNYVLVSVSLLSARGLFKPWRRVSTEEPVGTFWIAPCFIERDFLPSEVQLSQQLIDRCDRDFQSQSIQEKLEHELQATEVCCGKHEDW
ncbi:hypothetical protein V5799_020875 [Amblyomma americanum]|uniref:Uncharacterized protein n=1 Tax=Amblyomma americanum TaxID=6943 RepID=A0AAQ4ESL1_AMBAM